MFLEMHLSLTCLYSYCITVQKYADTTRNDYAYDDTCFLAQVTISYDHPVFLTANERRASFTYTARCF
jgi:hypothetical protein